MSTSKSLSVLAGAIVAGALVTANLPAHAGIINIGNGATGSNPRGTSGPGDPNLIGTGSDISIEVQGSTSINNQVLLTILVPNDTTNLFGTTNPLGTITTYPSFPNTSPTGTGSSAFTGAGFGLGSGTALTRVTGFGETSLPLLAPQSSPIFSIRTLTTPTMARTSWVSTPA